MSTHTDPLWTAFLWLGIGSLLLYIAADRLVVLLAWIDERDQRRRAVEAADWGEPDREQVEMKWDDLALGRVLAALDETDETYLFDAPEFAPPAAQRIRDRIRADHDAEVARFRAELEGWEAS